MKWLFAVLAGIRALSIASAAGPGVAFGQDPDDAAWAAADRTNTAEACQAYLSEFPAGRHAAEAFRCVMERALDPEAGPAPTIDVY